MKNIFYCVEGARMILEEWHTRRYQSLTQHGIWAYRTLQLLAEPKAKVYRFTPNAAMLAVLPADYDFWTKIGIRCGGQLLTLSYNKDLALGRTIDDCGKEVADSLSCNCCHNFGWGLGWVPEVRNGQYVGERYSMGGGANPRGYFNINLELNQIEMQNVPRVQLEMEYVGTGGDDGETLVPNMASMYIINSIVYRASAYDRRINDNIKQRMQDAMTLSKTEYDKAGGTPQMSEIYAMLNETSHFKL